MIYTYKNCEIRQSDSNYHFFLIQNKRVISHVQCDHQLTHEEAEEIITMYLKEAAKDIVEQKGD